MWIAHDNYESMLLRIARLESKVEYLELENASLKTENQKYLDTLAGLAQRRTRQDTQQFDPLSDPFEEVHAAPTIWLSDEAPDVKALSEVIE